MAAAGSARLSPKGYDFSLLLIFEDPVLCLIIECGICMEARVVLCLSSSVFF